MDTTLDVQNGTIAPKPQEIKTKTVERDIDPKADLKGLRSYHRADLEAIAREWDVDATDTSKYETREDIVQAIIKNRGEKHG